METKLRNLLKDNEPKNEEQNQIEEVNTKIGDLVYKDHFKYKGQILNDNIRDGFGTLKREPEDDDALCFKYEGPFQNDLLGEGPGEMIVYHRGERPLLHYKGGFKSSQFNQYGSLVTPDYTYDGHFEEGKKCGTGRIKHPFYCYEGIWHDDHMQGPGTLV